MIDLQEIKFPHLIKIRFCTHNYYSGKCGISSIELLQRLTISDLQFLDLSRNQVVSSRSLRKILPAMVLILLSNRIIFHFKVIAFLLWSVVGSISTCRILLLLTLVLMKYDAEGQRCWPMVNPVPVLKLQIQFSQLRRLQVSGNSRRQINRELFVQQAHPGKGV